MIFLNSSFLHSQKHLLGWISSSGLFDIFGCVQVFFDTFGWILELEDGPPRIQNGRVSPGVLVQLYVEPGNEFNVLFA